MAARVEKLQVVTAINDSLRQEVLGTQTSNTKCPWMRKTYLSNITHAVRWS